MLVVVDYDNIPEVRRRKGLEFMVDNIISLLDKTLIGERKRVKVRLYGGWRNQKKATRQAQNLQAEIERVFPMTYTLDEDAHVIVRCELANSLLAEPGFDLNNTFRYDRSVREVKALHPLKEGCAGDRDCPLLAFYDFINNKLCPKCGMVRPEDILRRNEQKLVDSMMVADMIFHSIAGGNLCVVSSDDDLWPGIRASLVNGCKLLHIHTLSSTSSFLYTHSIGSNYRCKQL